ncbi:PriCT-2 domain-containing protein [Desulfosediminicola flagellatus]|uniref:PriCT-2 domain-containing protein n=1 Tax=Desulfosediminicola flagellatus TaxID=2569541 RepID=UPI0010ABB226|nr:PriCT-2 domain-containing protein [Desulfosediminicola flagellatus]
MTLNQTQHIVKTQSSNRNIESARFFFKWLDPNSDEFFFWIHHPETKDVKDALIGSIDELWQELCLLNDQGYGIYVAVNQVNGRRRQKQAIARIRTVFQEDDENFQGDLPLAPSMVISTSPGKYHRYFLTLRTISPQARKEFDDVMRCMVERYGCDRNAKDITRVLRVPGFFNTKPSLSEAYLVELVSGSGIRYPWERIVEAFNLAPRPALQLPRNESTADLNEALEALGTINPDCDRDTWRNVGTALKEGFGEEAREHWIRWSMQSTNPNHFNTAEQLSKQWHSLSVDSGVNLRTLFYHAKANGWRKTVNTVNTVNSVNITSKTSTPSTNVDTLQGACKENYGISYMVDQFIDNSSGKFCSNDVTNYVSAHSRADKQAVYQKLERLVKSKKIRKLKGGVGRYETIGVEVDVIDFDEADATPVELPLPLGLDKMVNIHRGDIVLIQGESNAGKTMILMWVLNELLTATYNPISLTRYKDVRDLSEKPYRYLVTEGRMEYKNRMESFGSRPVKDWTKQCDFIDRSDYPGLHHQVTLENGITFIDYLDIEKDFYEAPMLINEIDRRLNDGIAIIAMQKSPGKDFAIGGAQVIAKPRLVITLENRTTGGARLILAKAKHSTDYSNKPQGLYMDFEITKDCRIIPLNTHWKRVAARPNFNNERG